MGCLGFKEKGVFKMNKRFKKYRAADAGRIPYINEGPVAAEIVSSVVKTLYRLGKKFVYGSGNDAVGTVGTDEGLFDTYIDPALRKLLQNIRYETASSDKLAGVYKDVNGKSHPQELGEVAIPEYRQGKVVGGRILVNKKAVENPIYKNHGIGHIVFEHKLTARGINPRTVPREAHERFAELFEKVDIGGEIGIAGN